jgi:hypothetical protein
MGQYATTTHRIAPESGRKLPFTEDPGADVEGHGLRTPVTEDAEDIAPESGRRLPFTEDPDADVEGHVAK